MRVLIIDGSVRKGQTDRILGLFEKKLRALGVDEVEHLKLRELSIDTCVGCANCLFAGEERCPRKDDRDLILAHMDTADGVVFASPNYSLQVSWLMKNMFDRLAFVFHRPRFFQKVSMGLITQGVYGGTEILKYVDNVASFWGFTVCKGALFTTPWGVWRPHTEWPPDALIKIEATLDQRAQAFVRALHKRTEVVPSWKSYMIFRMVRTSHRNSPEAERARDYAYFKEHGWFDSEYFCPARISPAKRLLGWALEKMVDRPR